MLRATALASLLLAALGQAAPISARQPIELPRIDQRVAVLDLLPLSRTSCHGLIGWLDRSDPGARIVRAAPSFDAPELGRIPQPVEMDEEIVPPEVRIIGSQDGWLEIEGAAFDATWLDRPAPATYSGRGWIMGEGLRVTVQAELGFARPSHNAPVVIDARPGGGVLEEFGPTQVIACQGRWILGEFVPVWLGASTVRELAYRREAVVKTSQKGKPQALRAWVAGICNNLETTCDGLDGNRAETSRLGLDLDR